MTATVIIALLIVFVALVFDYTNGFHDAANSIATVVSTRVLSPGKAVALAAFFNFVAAFGFGTHWRDHLEPHHLVSRLADQFIACAGGWICGRGSGQVRFRRAAVGAVAE